MTTTTTTRCPDCGQPTDQKLCGPCVDVAKSFGLTAQQRVEALRRKAAEIGSGHATDKH